MTRRKTHSRAYKPRPPFRTVEGIESAAWAELSPNAVWCLMEFYKRFNGMNRDNLSLPRGDVKGKIAPGTLSKSILELIAFGFIDVHRWGALEKNCSIYGLSHRWKNLSKSPQKLKSIRRLLVQIELKKRDKPDRQKKEKVRAMKHKILRISQ